MADPIYSKTVKHPTWVHGILPELYTPVQLIDRKNEWAEETDKVELVGRFRTRLSATEGGIRKIPGERLSSI